MRKVLSVFLVLMSLKAYSEEIYRMETKIGNNQFNDLLVINSCKDNILKGSVTVPGNFSSSLTGSCTNNLFNFKIDINENGQQYSVTYVINLKSSAEGTLIIGKMISGGEDLGAIQGKLIFRNNL